MRSVPQLSFWTCGVITLCLVFLLTGCSKQWTRVTITSAVPDPHLRLAFGAGQFLVAGDRTLMRSNDGVRWTAIPMGELIDPSAIIQSVSYGGDSFVLTTTTGAIMRSANGVEWETVSPPQGNRFIGLVYGHGRFLAIAHVGPQPTGLWTSLDGASWRPVDGTENRSWHHLIVTADGFAALDGLRAVLRSADGLVWVEKPLAFCAGPDCRPGLTQLPSDWAFGNNLYVVTTSSSGATGAGPVLTSPNGLNWTRQQAGKDLGLVSVDFVGGLFVAWDAKGSSQLYVSGDGERWTPWTLPIKQKGLRGITVSDVIVGNGKLVVAGPNRALFVRDLSATVAGERGSN